MKIERLCIKCGRPFPFQGLESLWLCDDCHVKGKCYMTQQREILESQRVKEAAR